MEQEWLIQRKEERGDKEMLGKEAEYKIFHRSLLDSSPRACFIAITCSTEWENGWENDAFPV